MSTIVYFREFSFIDLFQLDTRGKDFDKESTEERFISGKDSVNHVRTFEHFRFSTLLLVGLGPVLISIFTLLLRYLGLPTGGSRKFSHFS